MALELLRYTIHNSGPSLGVKKFPSMDTLQKLRFLDPNEVTGDYTRFFPDGSVVQELWNLKSSGFLKKFYRDCRIEIFPRHKDRAGNNQIQVVAHFDYVFSTENNAYFMVKPDDRFYTQMRLSVFANVYASEPFVIVMDYPKVLKIVEQYG